DLVRSGRVDPLAGEQQFHRVLPVDALGQADGADDGGHAEQRFWIPELGPLTGDDEVAPGDEREAVPEAMAVDRGDDRLEDLPAALERVRGRLLPERPGEDAGRAGPVAHVGAGAERPPGAGDDGDPRVLVVTEPAEGV